MKSKFKVNPSYILCILWHLKEYHGPVENRAKMFRQNKNKFIEDGFIVQWVVGSQQGHLIEGYFERICH